MIRAVLFDFGGVITTSPFEAFDRFERREGLPVGFLRRVNATDPDGNAWARLERGELGIDDFSEVFAAESADLGHRVDGRDVLGLLQGDVRPAMVEAVRRCSEAFATACLTNNFGTEDLPIRPELAEILELFDLVLESRVLGIRKPDPAFYALACQRLDVAPDEAVYLDDLGINLKPARAMGMQTIKVTSWEEALSELSAVTGLPFGTPQGR